MARTPAHLAALADLDAAQLTEVISHATELRAGKLEEARAQLEAEFAERAAALGLDPRLVKVAKRRGTPKGGKVAAKYRGPNGETWSGRGRAPRWLADLEAKGQKRDRYAV